MTQTTPERAMLERFLAWHKKWPKSVFYMNQEDIRDSECEMDDIMVEAQEFLNGK